MNRGFRTSTLLGAIALIALAALLSSSCERRAPTNTKTRKEVLNPQAKAYLDRAAEKEAANTERGWVHVEGKGYHYVRPKGWTETKDMKKGHYFQLTSPEKGVTIRLTSRYIESIPEGVHDLNDWAKLQYSSMGMPEALRETRKIEVARGDALEAWGKIGGSHLRVRSFVDIFRNPENQRSWILIVASQEKSRLESAEVQEFLENFRVENFRWLEQDDP